MKHTLLLLLIGVSFTTFFHEKSFAFEKDKNQTLEKILYYGTKSVNAHNAQMWKVKINSDKQIIILLDHSRLLPQVDPTNKEALISLGAFIENIVEVAPLYNLDAEVQVIADNPSDNEIAIISFLDKPNKIKNEKIASLILKRHTNRSAFKKIQINQQVLNKLSNEFGNDLYYFNASSKEGEYIKNSLIQSNVQQAYNDNKQKELAKWMRLSWHDVFTKQDGITPKMLGLPMPIRWLVYSIYNSNSVMSNSFRDSGVAKVKNNVNNCAGYFVLASNGNAIEDEINAGRFLEKFWIRATEYKIAIQPMSQILEESPWKDEINSQLKINKPISMVLRAGYVRSYGKPKSQRRSVNDIIIQ